MRSFCLLLMESTGLGSLPDSLACTESNVDAADPCKMRMQDCIGNDRPPVWSYVQTCAPFSCSAEAGFAVWEFRDLGSGVHGGGSTARATTTSALIPLIHTSSSRLRAPSANVVDRSSSKRKGFGSNMTIAVLGGLGSDAPEPWTSCKKQLAAHERVSVRRWIVLQIGQYRKA
jgi:hypothetical protein